MDNKQLASSYATAKCCGFTGSFDEFKKMYDQYYSEIIENIKSTKPSLAKVEAVPHPFKNHNF